LRDEDTAARVSAGVRGWIDDTVHALAFLTRLPVRGLSGAPGASRPRALRAYPLAGALIGLVGGLVLVLGAWFDLAPLLSATLAIAAMVAVTGALHEDALADTADGFGGGWTVDDKLEIMRDSRLGTYGALTLFLALAIRIAAVASLATSADGALLPVAALVAAAALSRAYAVSLLGLLPPARSDGLSAAAGTPAAGIVPQALVCGIAVALVAAWAAAGFTATLTAIAASAIALWLMKRLADRQIGGQTGDVAGACQQACECTFLVALAAAA
jgi:adenosylcobinamide-GDP ribazoletransferase